jgi:NAD+ synthase
LQATVLDLSEVKSKIIRFIKKKVEESQTDGVLVALDGGIDSAVTAYLCVEAVGSRRVIGMVMPDMRTATEEDLRDAKTVANELCLEVRQFDIAPIHRAFVKALEGNRLAEANLDARIRMAILYYNANLLNRLIAGALDRSEILLGLFSKYGDGGVDMLPIGDLYRTEVRKLGEVLGISRRIVAKRMKAGMSTSQWRLDTGMDYEATDQILKLRFDRGLDVAAISATVKKSRAKVESVISRYDSSSHKRLTPEVCAIR